MDEFTALINQIKSSPESMRQIREMASSLGLNVPAEPQPAPQPVQTPDLSALSSLLGSLTNNSQPQQAAPAPDLSTLAGLLGNLGGSSQPQQAAPAPDLSSLAGLLGNLGGNPQPQQASPAPDFSALSGLLGNLTGSNTQQAAPASNLSALTALLNGGNPPAQGSSGILPNLDMGILAKLSSALSSMQSNRENVNLLLALKPRLKEPRAKKVDDAIRVMQLVQFLPLIKESGLFGEMDNILGGLMGGNGLGGLGGLLGNSGGGSGLLSGLLGGLGRR